MLTETDPINGDAEIHEIEIVGDTAVRKVVLERKCHELHGHDHNHDHIVRVVRGKINLWVCKPDEKRSMDGVPKTLCAGDETTVKAGDWHTYKSISEDGSEVDCIFLLRDEDGNVAKEVTQHYSDRSWA